MAEAKGPGILVPVDGSENALRAVRYAIDRARASGAKIHVLNVQAPLRRDVTTFVPRGAVKDYHVEEARKALAPAVAALQASGVPWQEHIGVGPPGEVVAGFCEELGCGEIIMGTRGLGGLSGALLGSVSTGVIQKAPVPVTLVK